VYLRIQAQVLGLATGFNYRAILVGKFRNVVLERVKFSWIDHVWNEAPLPWV